MSTDNEPSEAAKRFARDCRTQVSMTDTEEAKLARFYDEDHRVTTTTGLSTPSEAAKAAAIRVLNGLNEPLSEWRVTLVRRALDAHGAALQSRLEEEEARLDWVIQHKAIVGESKRAKTRRGGLEADNLEPGYTVAWEDGEAELWTDADHQQPTPRTAIDAARNVTPAPVPAPITPAEPRKLTPDERAVADPNRSVADIAEKQAARPE